MEYDLKKKTCKTVLPLLNYYVDYENKMLLRKSKNFSIFCRGNPYNVLNVLQKKGVLCRIQKASYYNYLMVITVHDTENAYITLSLKNSGFAAGSLKRISSLLP